MCKFKSAVLLKKDEKIKLFHCNSTDSHSEIMAIYKKEFKDVDDSNFASIEILEDKIIVDEQTPRDWAEKYIKENEDLLFAFRLKDRNSGNRNSGNRNSGNRNSGNWNSGDRNSGDWNLCDRETGYFNSTQSEEIRIFGKPCKRNIWENTEKPDFIYFNLTEFISDYDMSEEEKKAHPEFEILGGYLKKYSYEEAWLNAWNKADDNDKKLLYALPNFDWQIFTEISGIEKPENL